MIRDDPCGSSVHKGPYKGKGTRRMRAIEGNVRSRGQRGDSRSCTDSFEKRKGPRAEGRRRPLDASKDEEMSPQASRENAAQPTQLES